MFGADELGTIPARVQALRARYALSDAHQAEIQAVRRGDFEAIAPDLFSDAFKRPVVANLIDTSARDMAAMLAPLPSFSCSSSSMLSERAKSFADKRSKIVRHYVDSSKLELQMADKGADNYNSYGMLVLAAEPDFNKKTPYIRVESSIGAYPVWDDKGCTKEFARVYYRDWFSIEADYPHLRVLKDQYGWAIHTNNQVECVKYVSDDRVLTYLPKMGNTPLEDMANPVGFCYYHVARRPNAEDYAIKGAYDDVVWVQLARHRIQMLLMEGIDKSVRAPLVVPPDVDDVSLGPDGIIHTQGGAQSVGRARLDMPNQAFSAVEQLKQEVQIGAMSPEARSGATDASIITGKGLQELASGFNSQISVAQMIFKHAFAEIIEKCFRLDEILWPDVSKDIRGNDNGVPYSLSYSPKKDINEDYTVDISFGFAAGLDPNRALVFLLQADGAGLVSKDYVRRSLPVDLNAAEEEKKIVVEQSRQSIILAFSALAQSIPQLAAAGQDPSPIIGQQAKFIMLLQKGLTVEEAAAKAMAPPEPPPGASSPGDATSQDGSASGGAQGGPQGFDQGTGLPGALKPGTALEGPQGRPDLSQMFAGLSASGKPNLTAGVSRFNPVANG
jgi:hypothetical protein